MSLFKRKEKVEPVKVVFVTPPKQDFGTRMKNLDFDPFSLGVGAAVPAVGIGVYKGVKAVAGMRSFHFIMRAVIADVSTETNSFAEYCENVHNYLKDHPLTDRYNNHQKAVLEQKLIRKLDKYWTKHPHTGCEFEDEDGTEDIEDEEIDEILESVHNRVVRDPADQNTTVEETKSTEPIPDEITAPVEEIKEVATIPEAPTVPATSDTQGQSETTDTAPKDGAVNK